MKPSGPSQRFPTSLTGGADGVANNGNSFDGVGRGGYTSSIDPESMEESKMSELSNIHLSAQRTESRLNIILEYLTVTWLRDPRRRRGCFAVSATCFGLSALLLLAGLPLDTFQACNLAACLSSIGFMSCAMWILGWILQRPEGSTAAQGIAWAIQEGSEGFYSTINTYISRLAIVTALGLFVCYAFRSEDSFPKEIRKGISPVSFAGLSAFTFLVGAGCSALSGYSGVWVSIRANSRVAAAAHRTYKEALQICFRGGAFSSIVNVAIAVGSLSLLMMLCRVCFPEVPVEKIPILLVGFGFGASFVAMFAQLGGGIYTKAADVGADLVGKVEAGMPEDDYRNPAVIADLVGDNVGDCAGQCADLFESLAAEMLAAMILGSALISESQLSIEEHLGFVLFPLAVHTMDLLISSVAVMFVGEWESSFRQALLPSTSASPTGEVTHHQQDPLRTMIIIYFFTCVVGAVGFVLLCYWLLNAPTAPNAWKHFSLCGVSGIVCAVVFLFATQYYTDYKFSKVQRIATASKSGAATNVIAGLAVGMESTAIPVIAISMAIVFSYHQGMTSGIAPEHSSLAGLFGTAVATMGMLSTAVYVLSMSSFGPIADNAGGIVEMSYTSTQDPIVRDITDRLDAVGNVTKANTKGFSVGTAALASFLLFSAFLDEVTIFTKKPFNIVDITSPDVFVGGLLGACVIFLFSSLAINAVGTTAIQVVTEVRQQLKEHPAILQWAELPDYKRCVAIVSAAAIKQMVAPGLLAVLSPLVVGVLFKLLGENRGQSLLGVEALGAFMMFATSTGILMALFLNNGGGAWDNAKKYIETGKHGGKGSETHKASVVGDTVGDPCKDTAGPSVHVLIKLIATVTLVMTPLFVTVQDR